MKNKHKRRANGFGLVETLLTLGALSALSLGIYMVLAPASANVIGAASIKPWASSCVRTAGSASTV